MKLTEEQKKRLAALLAKAADTLTADEKTELADLQAKALADGLTLDDNFIKTYGEPGTITDAQLGKAITDAVTAAFANQPGLDSAPLIAEIKKLIPTSAATGLKLADVEALITKHAPKQDNAALVLEITKAMQASQPVITREIMDAAIAEAVKNAHSASTHQFAVVGAVAPVAHRSGNLTVAQKQLLNICLMAAPDDALAVHGTKRPTNINDGIGAEPLAQAKQYGEMRVKSLRETMAFGKALTTTGAGTGAEFMPSDLSGELQTRLYLESQLAASFLASEIDMPTDPFKLPLRTTRTTFFTGAQGTAPAANVPPGTGKVTLTTGKLIGVADYSYEADEDSIVAILPMLMDDMSSGAAYTFESAIINGDADGTHQDADYQAIAEHHAKVFDGLRKWTLAGANLTTKLDISTGGTSAANIAAMRKQMGKWGINPKDLLFVVGPKTYNNLLGLPETLTFDKVGNPDAARILSGVAGSIYGIKIIVSEAMREDVSASGFNTAGGQLLGTCLLLNRPSFVVGVRRGFTVEVETNKRAQLNYVIASFRRALMPKETISASMPLAICGYNWTP